jgi:hypothetical protein
LTGCADGMGHQLRSSMPGLGGIAYVGGLAMGFCRALLCAADGATASG